MSTDTGPAMTLDDKEAVKLADMFKKAAVEYKKLLKTM